MISQACSSDARSVTQVSLFIDAPAAYTSSIVRASLGTVPIIEVKFILICAYGVTSNALLVSLIYFVSCPLLCLRASTTCAVSIVLILGTGNLNGDGYSSTRLTRYATILPLDSLDWNGSAALRDLLFWYRALHFLL